MKLLYKFTAVVALLALTAVVFSIITPDVAHAAGLLHSAGHLDFSGLSHALPPALVALHRKRDDIKVKAKKKRDEITDELDADQVRTIEDEHAAMLRDLESVEEEIRNFQQEEDEDDADPASGTAGLTGPEAADALRSFRRAGMTDEQVDAALRSCASMEDVRVRVFDHLSETSSRTRIDPARVTRDEAETRRFGLTAALAYRMGGDEPEGEVASMARGFMELRDAVEFAAEFIGHRGSIRSVREREDVLSRAFHSASDFPAIFSDAINTSLERRYALREPTYREISRRRDFMDFRPHYAVGIGEFPMLEKLTEAGEIRFGTFGESKEQIAVVPYAKGIRVSRQMLVNDRLGAIAELMGGYGRTVSRFEEITFYAMMLSASTKLADGKVVFHADHANLAGSNAAINVASIGAGKAAMRKQKGLDDATLNLTPSILLVSPDKETEALQYIAPITANDSVKVNPHVGTLSPIVSGELTGNAWYLFADPEEAAVYQWGLLDGYTAPRVRFDEPFGTQGIGMTVEHDFGVGAIDYRGGYKNTGA